MHKIPSFVGYTSIRDFYVELEISYQLLHKNIYT